MSEMDIYIKIFCQFWSQSKPILHIKETQNFLNTDWLILWMKILKIVNVEIQTGMRL